MADPLVPIAEQVRAALAAAFGQDAADAEPAIARSAHADLQCNAAFALAKRLKRPPRQIAEAIAAGLAGDAVERAEVAGPGFINIALRADFIAREVAKVAADPDVGIARARAPERVVIDYSSPNVAKEMHVGHLRSTVIGDALARAMEALGHTVIRQNHLGDWGTQFGMLVQFISEEAATSDVANASIAPEHVTALYRDASAKFKADPEFAERARGRVVALQAGDEATLALWRQLVNASRAHFNRVYELLGVTLKDSDLAGESFYNDKLAGVVAELEDKGLAVDSEGAKCVFVPGFSTREGDPLPLIIRKQDGGYGYATTDLVAIRYRLSQLKATRILYVVGAPQAQHLAMVFKVAQMAGWLAPPARAEHVAFGSVLGEDNKVLRTRAGESVRLLDLLHEAVDRAGAIVAQKSPELPAEQRAQIARAVGIGAVKYADLSSDRVKDYVFAWERMLAFDGNTAPYLQYAHARIRSILRKAGRHDAGAAIVIEAAEERALALSILALPTVVGEVAELLAPHRLCGYLYALASAFSAFYEHCPVLKAPSEASRQSRLLLCAVTARVLARGLDLLGIEAPQQM